MTTKVKIKNTKLSLILGDIVLQKTDAIVNPANTSLMGGGGVDGAIHRAGGKTILFECEQIIRRIGKLNPGQAVITGGGNLKARYIVHTVGPVWYGGSRNEDVVLASSYRESLRLASSYGITSISFPSISTGAYRYPVQLAAKVAINTTLSFLNEETTSLLGINFVLFDENTFNTYATAIDNVIA
jgi:O-acetyl-ADP-ribose deacetylase (regulator of RNase III)